MCSKIVNYKRERYNMNITNNTDIFFIAGQWNWDAISTISNFILVGTLVCITWQYAKQIKEQTELMEKDRERNKILEGIQQVLTPSISILTSEIEGITNSTRMHFAQKFNEFFDRKRYYSYAFWDIMDEFTDLAEKLHSNDKFTDKLNTFYNKIKKEVTDNFERDGFNKRQHLIEMVNMFNKSNPEVLYNEKDTHTLYQLENICKNYIINKWDLSNNIPEASVSQINFLKQNKGELQKYIDIPKIKELYETIKETSNVLKKSDEDILERFGEIIKEYRKVYHFSEDEINPSIKQKRDFQNRRA